ncbi:MAG: helix-turn-helix domain-containing protein [Clostridia bacterium]
MENNERIGISIDEAAKMLNIGRNLMLEMVKMDGFPAMKFKRKIIINKLELPKWFANNYGKYTY